MRSWTRPSTPLPAARCLAALSREVNPLVLAMRRFSAGAPMARRAFLEAPTPDTAYRACRIRPVAMACSAQIPPLRGLRMAWSALRHPPRGSAYMDTTRPPRGPRLVRSADRHRLTAALALRV